MKRSFVYLACALALVACNKETPKSNGDDINNGDIDTPVVDTAQNLSTDGTANCYIVSVAGEYKFEAVKGNTTESVGTVSSAEVLWESFGTDVTPKIGDVICNVSCADGYVRFSTPSKLNNGNAVIVVKDASNNILWSWHIWVCDGYNPITSKQVYNNAAGTMMDRNLGATSATPGDVHALGLMYQWGRKDPFLGANKISSNDKAASTLLWPSSVASDATIGTIAYAVAHPTTFIQYNLNNSDWYYNDSSTTDNTRWNSNKGVYDPCPAGWRVPDGGTSGIWATAFNFNSSWNCATNWSSTGLGMDFGNTDKKLGTGIIWYPATGRLLSADGTLYVVGDYGYCWSCTPYNHMAHDLFFELNGSVILRGGLDRAVGLPVRCQQQ